MNESNGRDPWAVMKSGFAMLGLSLVLLMVAVTVKSGRLWMAVLVFFIGSLTTTLMGWLFQRNRP